jgi:hypothetical protein
MAHRSHEMSRLTKVTLGMGAALGLFLVSWTFLPWWGAALVTAGAGLGFLVSEHINWSAIDWRRLWEW